MLTKDKLTLTLKRLVKHNLTGVEVTDRREVNGVVAGYLLAMHCPLPTTPVTQVTNYYVTQHESTITNILNQVNEEVFLNPQVATETARNVYQFRYNMVHEPETMINHLLPLYQSDAIGLPPLISKLLERISPEVLQKSVEYCA